jgi:hypothetical protein
MRFAVVFLILIGFSNMSFASSVSSIPLIKVGVRPVTKPDPTKPYPRPLWGNNKVPTWYVDKSGKIVVPETKVK